MKENTEQLSSEEKQYRKMTEEPVCRLIMKLGLPTTISMLIKYGRYLVCQPAWNKCDRSSWYRVWSNGNYSGVRFYVWTGRRNKYQQGFGGT